MVALGRRAGVPLDGLLGGTAVHAGVFIEWVAHAGCGEFGQHGFQGGAQLGGQPAAEFGHAVGVLVAEGEAAAAGAVFVAVEAVGVEAIGQRARQCCEVFGPIPGAFPGQVGFGALPGRLIDPAGQLVAELTNDGHLLGTQRPGPLRGGGGRQQRRQRFPGQPDAGAQVGGGVHPPGGLGAADQRRLGDRMRKPATQLRRAGVAGQRVDQRMLDRRQPPAQPFAAVEQRQLLTGGQRGVVAVEQIVQGSIDGVERRRHRLPITTHNRKLGEPTDKNRRNVTTETKVTQGISLCVLVIRNATGMPAGH